MTDTIQWLISTIAVLGAIGTFFTIWLRGRKKTADEIRELRTDLVNRLDSHDRLFVEHCAAADTVAKGVKTLVDQHAPRDGDNVPVWYFTQNLRDQVNELVRSSRVQERLAPSVDQLSTAITALNKSTVGTITILQRLMDRSEGIQDDMDKLRVELRDMNNRSKRS